MSTNKVPIRHSGNENLFLAVEMSLISTAAGIPLHIHAEGLRGTGKTTVMRWARQLAPDIHRIKGCLYQCNPESPHCPTHSQSGEIAPDQHEASPMPFSEIGHGAKLGTILGSVDLGKLTDPQNPQAALIPGSIPMANRGIVFIDEINRLAETAPEITDVLLSVMGTKPGKLKIEEVGLKPWELDITSSVWAASNPDEDPGPLEEIRRQLSDRFDMVVPVQRPSDPLVIEKLLWRNHQGLTLGTLQPAEIKKKALSLGKITVPQSIIRYMAELYVEKNIESLRTIQSLELCSRCLAAIREKSEVTFDELSTVLPLVLRHRVEPMVLSEILRDLELRQAASVQVPPDPEPDDGANGLNNPGSPSSGNNNEGDPDKCLDESGQALSCYTRNKAAQRYRQIQPPAYGPGSNGQKKVGWIQRLISRWQANASHLQPSQCGNSNRYGDPRLGSYPDARQATGNNTSGNAAGQPESPSMVPPASPPDPARRIGYLSWDEVLLPSQWKDYI